MLDPFRPSSDLILPILSMGTFFTHFTFGKADGQESKLIAGSHGTQLKYFDSIPVLIPLYCKSLLQPP